jgi:tetratricopeptide (TPR) repeat protein
MTHQQAATPGANSVFTPFPWRWIGTVLLWAALVGGLPLPAPQAAEEDPLEQARAYIAEEKYVEASSLLRKVTKKDGAPLDAFLLLGAAYEAQGLFKRAIAEYEQVMRMDKYNLEGGLGLGRNLVHYRNQRSRAVSLYESLLKQYPDEPRLNYALGIAYNEMAEVSYAFDQYKILKKRDPALAKDLYDVIFMR